MQYRPEVDIDTQLIQVHYYVSAILFLFFVVVLFTLNLVFDWCYTIVCVVYPLTVYTYNKGKSKHLLKLKCHCSEH